MGKMMYDNVTKERVAVITGAARGIGRQISLDMAGHGVKVAGMDINKKELISLQEEIKADGGSCLIKQLDVSNEKMVKKVVKEVVEHFNGIDILVNNAGIVAKGTIEDINEENMKNIFSVNLKGVIYLIKAVVKYMKKNKFGRIINISSIAGKKGDNTTLPCYGASKGAVITLTRSLARELGPYKITVNAIAPHAIMTPMMDYWDEEKKKRVKQSIPVKRLGEPQDVSFTVMFLASEQSSFITGETINVNGGYYMD